MINELADLDRLVVIQNRLVESFRRELYNRPVALVLDRSNTNLRDNKFLPEEEYNITISFKDGSIYKFLSAKCVEEPTYEADAVIRRAATGDALILITQVRKKDE